MQLGTNNRKKKRNIQFLCICNVNRKQYLIVLYSALLYVSAGIYWLQHINHKIAKCICKTVIALEETILSISLIYEEKLLQYSIKRIDTRKVSLPKVGS